MAVTVVGSAEVFADAAPAVVGVPAGTQDGDLMVALFHHDSSGVTPGAVSGWTLEYSNNAAAPTFGLYSRLASSEPTSYQFDTSTGNASRLRVHIVTLRGANEVGTIGVIARASSTTIAAASINATGAGALISAFSILRNSALPATPPSGMTEIADSDSNTTRPVVYAYSLIPSSAGATGTKTMVWSESQTVSGISFEVLVSSQSITGAHFDNAESFGSAIASASYDIAGAALANTASFQAATVTASYNIAGTLFEDGETFGSALLTQGFVINAALFQDGDSFGAASVEPGAVSVSGSLFANAASFAAGSLSASYSIAGSLYEDADSFGAGTLTTSVTLTGALFENESAFGSATLAEPPVIPIDPARQIATQPEIRMVSVEAESRRAHVIAESRLARVEPEIRIAAVLSETRLVAVEAEERLKAA